ncbi:MAG: DUF1501 domain-containing protein [Deltaproteobacteria bacterium]|nr:MAG: DUF1501 domain-containing protein [Deltaproteobacteria bacterium]
MIITRRKALMSALFGAGYVGLRALATGIPATVLLKGRRAFADGAPACINRAKAQFIVLATSGSGDPINANVPGTYADPLITHSADPTMAATAMTLGGRPTTAALPWTQLPQSVLDRTTFWHIMTNTPVHPKQPDVLKLMGMAAQDEMLPSLLAKQLAPCLGTVQAQPITVGANSPSEGLSFSGQALPIIPPLALKATLTMPTGPLANLVTLRDQTLSQISDLYRNTGNAAQKAYLDSLIASQSEIRNIRQDLLASLTSIKDNSVASQITAAIALIQMNVTPVIAIHIPFGGDNHNDAALGNEARQTVSGVASIASLMSQLASAGLSDQVTFMSLNVFGRTLGPRNTDGRQHNPNHQVSITIGKPFKPGVIGAVGPVAGDYGALAINSQTGAGGAGGDIDAGSTLASFGKTTLAAVGLDSSTVDASISTGKVIQAALA